VPSVARAVLNHTIPGFEENFGSVIQFENHFAGDNHVEVHRAGSVHARMIAFQDVEHARQLLLNFFDSRRGVETIDARSGVRRYGEEAEAETVYWGEIARVRRRRAVRGKLGTESLPHKR